MIRLRWHAFLVIFERMCDALYFPVLCVLMLGWIYFWAWLLMGGSLNL